jgi:signal transduction histidine kinase
MRALASDMSAEHAEAISDIQACMDRIGLLCSELKRFSAEQPPKPKPTDVPALVQEVVRRLTGSAEGIELRASVPSLLPECRWDGQQIDQAMTELLENAIRHTPKGKAIEVSAEPFEQGRRQYVRLTVRNEGDGVEGPYKDRIFEPFFSLRPGGTGLGLAIVWQIIKNHKGSIRETGEPGRFARFVIELPARPFEERSDESPGD